MATSNALSTTNTRIKYTITITQNSQSIEGNKSNVTVSVRFYRTNTGYTTYGSGTVYCKINGTQYSESVTSSDKITNSGIVLFTKTLDIPHNDDGTKTLTCSAWISHSQFDSNEQDYSEGLTTIPRASQPSLVTYPETTNDVGEFGEEFSIHMNRKSPLFTHTVRYEYGSRSGVIARDVGTGVKWKVPLEFMNDIPGNTSASGRIYVDTYKISVTGTSTFVGTKYTGFTVTVPASIKPTCSIQVLDNTPHKDFYGNLVKGLSKLYVKTTGTPSYSSPITAYSVTANGVRYTGNEIVTGVLSAAGTTTVSAIVKDKRGRTSNTASASFDVLDYNAPAITKLSAVRCNEDGSANKRGSFAKVTFSATVTSLNDKNNALYYLKYKATTDTNYTTVGLTSLTNNYAPTDSTVIFEASAGKSYDVSIVAVDRHNSSNPTTKSTKVPTATAIISWRGFKKSSGTEDGIGIGKVPEKPNTLEVGWNAEFDKPVIFKENQYCFASDGTYGAEGFVRIAEITIKREYIDAPIVFELLQRNASTPMVVSALFISDSVTNPALKTFWYEGSNYGAYLSETSPGVWGLYVLKSKAHDDITLSRWYTAEYLHDFISVTFPGNLVSTVPTGLRGYYRAVPAILPSIIDCLLPVGTIIHRHDHADPNNMYPGTTWVRIENAFLWGCDSSGTIGQTGGEKTHILTVDEIPMHDHGSVYSQNAAGTKSQAWYTTSGDKLAYGVVNTGGNEPHNNMPPYTQVSIWRRTA